MDSPEAAGGAVVASEGGAVSTSVYMTGDALIDAMPFTTRVWFNEKLYESVTRAATMMAKAKGFVPETLLGKTETCFSVALTALDAGLNPFMLAQGAYQTPDGKVGYETKAVQAIVEGKGFFSKPPDLDFTGPWEKLIGMHKKVQNEKTKKWSSTKTWTAQEAKGCKLQVAFHFRDLPEPVVCEAMDLAEVGTHFSTGWALEPKNQFARLVIRRQLQLKRPSIMAGVRCIEDLLDEAPVMKDITPPKDGNAHMGEFADGAPEQANATVVVEETVEPAEDEAAAPAAETKADADAGETPPAEEAEKSTKPAPTTKTADAGGVTLWVSADEPAKPFKDLPAAIFVLRRLIKEAATPALAKATMDRNIDTIAQLDKRTADGIETILNRRFEDEGIDQGSLV